MSRKWTGQDIQSMITISKMRIDKNKYTFPRWTILLFSVYFWVTSVNVPFITTVSRKWGRTSTFYLGKKCIIESLTRISKLKSLNWISKNIGMSSDIWKRIPSWIGSTVQIWEILISTTYMFKNISNQLYRSQVLLINLLEKNEFINSSKSTLIKHWIRKKMNFTFTNLLAFFSSKL